MWFEAAIVDWQVHDKTVVYLITTIMYLLTDCSLSKPFVNKALY